ncbi:MAG: hypothetical protein ACP5SH_01030 [Syntrophobacteraceae bacterium]
MTGLGPTILFSCIIIAGVCLIAYGVFLRPRSPKNTGKAEGLPLGFSDSRRQSFELLDLDMGHEGLTHRQKERFDPGRHRPELLTTGNAPAEAAPIAGQENKPIKIDIS